MNIYIHIYIHTYIHMYTFIQIICHSVSNVYNTTVTTALNLLERQSIPRCTYMYNIQVYIVTNIHIA